MIAVLIAVFALAAGLKAARPGVTAREFSGLGLPRPRLLARLVPLVEVAVVIALLAVPAWGAAAATVLLGCFTTLLVDVVRSGRTVSCGCLGAMGRRPVSWATVARNLALMAVAVAAVAVPALRWPTPALLTTAALVVVPTGLILVVGFQLLTLRHTLGRLWSVELAGDTAAAAITAGPTTSVPTNNPNLPPGSSTGRNHR